MQNELQLDELLYRWEELSERGETAALDSLCAENPKLADELTRRVDILKSMNCAFATDVDCDGADCDSADCDSADCDGADAFAELTIPGYEMLNEIGAGGMGIVYKARQRRLDRIVAIKTMRGGPSATQEDIVRFHTEAESAAKLSHPGIVAIHEVGEVEGRQFFSMDFVEGKNLDELIRETSLSGRRAARYLQSIAEAISAAHEQGILHRDLKPSNVLIDVADQPRITDFGLAKRIDGDSKQTATGQLLGTPSFMPPEQAIGDKDNVGVRSDVYALGGLLYSMLTGRPPFRAESAVATVMQVINDEPVPPRHLNAAIDRDLETICLKCLEKNPHARYATAGEVGAECERFLSGHPIHARPIGALARGGRWCRRNPIVAALAASVVVALLLGTVVSTYYAIQSNNNLSLVREQKKIAEANALKAEQSEKKAVGQAALLKAQTALLQKSIHSYMNMYLKTCAIGGDIAAASDVDDAFAAFEKFDSREQLVTNNYIANATKSIHRLLTEWKEQGGSRPEGVNFAVLELTKQCRLAWEHRCDAISSRRRGETSSAIRDIERQLVVNNLYDRAIRAARGLAGASDVTAARGFRNEFEKLYWGELHFVESERLNSNAVESAMFHIRKCLEPWNDGPPPSKLAQLVSDLELACSDSLTSAEN